MFSISCGLLENLVKLELGVPRPDGESWIRLLVNDYFFE